MRPVLATGAAALLTTLVIAFAAVPDAAANPKNKFSDGSTASVDISTSDSEINVQAEDGDVSLVTTKNFESFNVDVEVIGFKEMRLTVSGVGSTVDAPGNQVVVSGSANGGSNSCATGIIGAGVGCGTVKNDNNSGNGGNASANTGSINIGTNAFQFFGGVNSHANNTGNNVAQVADTVMPVNAVVNFR